MSALRLLKIQPGYCQRTYGLLILMKVNRTENSEIKGQMCARVIGNTPPGGRFIM